MAGADRAVRLLTSTAFLGLVLAALAWPIASIVPVSGPDASWQAGLYMAHSEGLQFGKEIVFTYGPLGFLQDPVLYDQAMWALAFLFQATIHVALAISLLWSARRALPLALAAVACYVLLVVGGLGAAAVLLAFAWCFVALGDRPPRFAVPLVTVGGGLLAAVELLAKANYGVAILALALVAVLGLPDRRRNVPLFAAVTVGAFVACWAVAGQELSDIPVFVSRSAEVISGYSAAMATAIVAQHWERLAALGGIALLLAGAGFAARRDPLSRRVASLALVALFCFATFKQGFVRQGIGNTPEFFVLLAGAGIVVASRLPRLPFRAAALGLVVPLAGLSLAVLPSPSIWESLKPEHHVEYLRQDLDALLRPGERTRLIADARRALRSSYRIDPAILGALRGHSVHIDPWEIGLAWAYRLDWHPLPAIQSYTAYTSQLDGLNAAAMSGPGAPEMILRHRGTLAGTGEASIDDRFPGWESPAAMRAMLCHYRPLETTQRWQLLERSGDRCGAQWPIGVVRSMTDERIPVPSPPGPRDLVFARVDGVDVEGWERVRTLLYRARERTATLGAHGTWRLVPATAEDGLVLRAPRRVDYPAPFRIAPDSRTISLHIDAADRRSVTVHFFAQRASRFSGLPAERPGDIRP
jgi:hypothetical protein